MTLLVILKELQVLILSIFSWANEVTEYQSKEQKAQSELPLCHKSKQWTLTMLGWSRIWDSKGIQLRAGLQCCASHCTAHTAPLPDEEISSISVSRHLPSIRCPLVQAPGPWRVRPAWRFVPVAVILENVEGKREGKKSYFSLVLHMIHLTSKYFHSCEIQSQNPGKETEVSRSIYIYVILSVSRKIRCHF